MADVIAILFVAGVIATVMYFNCRCYCHILVGWCYCPTWYVTRMVADVIAISLLADVIALLGMLLGWWQMLLPLWLLLLPLVGMMYHSVADVIAMFVGWCCCQDCVLLYSVAGAIATMADGIAISENDVTGRCYCQGGRWNSLPGWMCGQML